MRAGRGDMLVPWTSGCVHCEAGCDCMYGRSHLICCKHSVALRSTKCRRACFMLVMSGIACVTRTTSTSSSTAVPCVRLQAFLLLTLPLRDVPLPDR